MSRHSIKRIECIVGEINAYLVIVAIGLAMLVLLAALEMPLVPTLCGDRSSISNMPESNLELTLTFASLDQ